MIIEQIPSFIRLLYFKVVWRMNSQEKKIYLTFDDGPIPEVTPWVLDLLDQYGIKATFFCVGENVMRYPGVYEEILKRGHRTGNHTYNHLRGLLVTSRLYLANVEKASEYIDSSLFRPPHGIIRIPQFRAIQKKYTIVQSDVVTRDYDKDLPRERVLEIVRKFTRNGSILVFHDSLKAEQNLRWALPQAIEWLQQEGYEFGLL